MNEKMDKQKINERIIFFINHNSNLTLATCSDNRPYCANCFYAYDEERNLFIIKSSPETNHIGQALANKNVAGSITPDKLDKSKIQGIQFQGNFTEPQNELLESLKKVYYGKYPFALAFSGAIWGIEPVRIKMTDNTLGFGKKIEWSK